MQVVNAVGGGELDREVQLDVFESNLPQNLMTNSTSNGLHISQSEEDPTVTLFRSGKYSIAGAGSVSELYRINDEFLNLFCDVTGWDVSSNSDFEVRYLVGIGNTDTDVNLEILAGALPADKVQYEPEQFPGLFYRPTEDTTIIAFSTGKVSVNGPTSEEQLNEEFEEFSQYLA